MQEKSRFRHVPALDGLRGIAVLAVLLYHGGVGWLPGGFLGVDLFFVLSGFLITSLLLDEGTIRLGRFWARRARRLFPALLVLLAGACLYARFATSPEARAGLRSDIFWTLGYGANWHFIAARSSYFALTAAPSPLAHTWSLAIEEQFYVVWPLLLLALRRFTRSLGAVAGLTAAGMGVSAVAMALLYRPGDDPSRVYYGTDTRCQVILAGALAAVALTAWRRRMPGRLAGTRAAGIFGAAAVPAAAAVLLAMHSATGDSAWVYQGGLTAVAVLGTIVVVSVNVAPDAPLSRALSWRPLRAVGLISYGLYLYHWPLYLVIDHQHTDLRGYPLLVVRMAVTFAAAALSYHLIEMPVRRRTFGGWRLVVSVPVAVGASAVAAVAATAVPAMPAVSGFPAAAGHSGQPVSVSQNARTNVTEPATTATVAPGAPRSSLPPLAPGQPLDVMFIGDSVAETLGDGMEAEARQQGVDIDNEGVLGCGVITDGPYRYFGGQYSVLPQCLEWQKRWEGLVAAHKPDVVFLVVGRWEVMDRMYQGSWSHLGEPAFDAHVESLLEQAIHVLSSSGAVVAFATAPYYLRGETPSGGRYPEDDPARVDAFNSLVRHAVAADPRRATLVDLNARTSVGGTYTPYIDGIEMRYDGVHFTPVADRWLEPWLIPQLQALAPR